MKKRLVAKSHDEIYHVRNDKAAQSLKSALGIPDRISLGLTDSGLVMIEGIMGAMTGDKEAVMRSIRRVSYFLVILNKTVVLNLEDCGEIGKGRSLWPVMSGPSPKVASQNAAFFESIGLGVEVNPARNAEDVGIVSTEAKRAAVALISFIEAIRSSDSLAGCHAEDPSRVVFRAALASSFTDEFLPEPKYTDRIAAECVTLPPLGNDAAVIAQWWKAGQQLLMVSTSGKPEGIDGLYKIGEWNKDHESAAAVLKNTRDIEDIPSDAMSRGGSASNVRAAIFKRLKKEFKSIAVNIPKRARTMTSEEV